MQAHSQRVPDGHGRLREHFPSEHGLPGADIQYEQDSDDEHHGHILGFGLPHVVCQAQPSLCGVLSPEQEHLLLVGHPVGLHLYELV